MGLCLEEVGMGLCPEGVGMGPCLEEVGMGLCPEEVGMGLCPEELDTGSRLVVLVVVAEPQLLSEVVPERQQLLWKKEDKAVYTGSTLVSYMYKHACHIIVWYIYITKTSEGKVHINLFHL